MFFIVMLIIEFIISCRFSNFRKWNLNIFTYLTVMLTLEYKGHRGELNEKGTFLHMEGTLNSLKRATPKRAFRAKLTV